MRAEFVNPFLMSLINVMNTMAQLELKPGAPRKKSDELARGDVSGLIGLVGPQTRGSFSISFEKSLALEVMRRMLGEAPTSINEEVTDMVGESPTWSLAVPNACWPRRVTSSIWLRLLSYQEPTIPSPIRLIAPSC